MANSKKLIAQMKSYKSYHRDWRNKATHFVGVPMVVIGIFISLGWFRLKGFENQIFMSFGSVFFLGSIVYYWSLDRALAVVLALINLPLLYTAELFALSDWKESIKAFVFIETVAWSLQLLGHKFEGKRPALVDNLGQIFNAPLMLALEVLIFLGFKKEIANEWD